MKKASAVAWPREACGLLFGESGAINAFREVRNVAERPETHFELDPAALFAALRAQREGGPRVIGYWHSHPSGSAAPSITDATMAAPDGKLWVILGGDEVRCWRAGIAGLHDRFAPVQLMAI